MRKKLYLIIPLLLLFTLVKNISSENEKQETIVCISEGLGEYNLWKSLFCDIFA